ncbi:MAG: DUF2079 domain-containing protein [Aulosira sp. ZfuVER01]|nr:DUF2079 domain-containing protein [Aulosira sp. ZfuVER01]MDZ8000066.1 DUF2079 domain-containing protein [Aulosira sp. DedVER01a]MDZ8054980.1 DUF2079 domain-containing protein [Aulosira sp. ZfuCHP01]
MEKKLEFGGVSWMIGISALILFACSSLRHELFQSLAWDLGIFDQAIYLISQGKSPISSLIGFHILGDHAAWILYPLALLYKIHPSVYWLFAVQAIALALGALPTWYLARQAGLKDSQALAIPVVYLLYPLIFNVNLFDFHPEVMAVPALLGSVLAARGGKIWWFCASILVILGCKAVLSLTVAAMGIWLLIFEKRRLCGAIAIFSGIVWFAIATKAIIPYFGTEAASIERHIGRYSYLGNSFSEIPQNLLSKPEIIFGNLFSTDNLGYLILLIAPVIWGFSLQGITPLVAAIPSLGINLLAEYQPQKELLHQYSLPILPFLLLAVINTLATGRGWLQNKRTIILWSLVAFLSLAKFTYFTGKYLKNLDNWQATREAIALVETQGTVLTTDELAPHLSHRQFIYLMNRDALPDNFNTFDYILINTRQPGLSMSKELAVSLVKKLQKQPIKLQYQQDEVYLFTKK